MIVAESNVVCCIFVPLVIVALFLSYKITKWLQAKHKCAKWLEEQALNTKKYESERKTFIENHVMELERFRNELKNTGHSKRPVMQFTMQVVGTKYRLDNAKKVVKDELVKLKRDPDNKHDKNAIEIHAVHGMIGFVPKEYSKDVAEIIDSGTFQYKAKIFAVNGPPNYSAGLVIEFYGES